MLAGGWTGLSVGLWEEFVDCVVEAASGEVVVVGVGVKRLGFGETSAASSEEESVSEDDDEGGAGVLVGLGFALEAVGVEDNVLVDLLPELLSSLLTPRETDKGAFCP